jgi:hypothetical protein
LPTGGDAFTASEIGKDDFEIVDAHVGKMRATGYIPDRPNPANRLRRASVTSS